MFAHVAIHYPKPEYSEDLLASMHRVGEAAAGSPGLIQIGAWRDARTNSLVGIALWESAEAFEAAAGRIFAAVADDPFDLWCERPIDSYLLTSTLPNQYPVTAYAKFRRVAGGRG